MPILARISPNLGDFKPKRPNLRLFQSKFPILPRFPLKNPLSFLPPALQYIGEYAPMGPNSVCGLIRHEILQLETKL